MAPPTSDAERSVSLQAEIAETIADLQRQIALHAAEAALRRSAVAIDGPNFPADFIALTDVALARRIRDHCETADALLQAIEKCRANVHSNTGEQQ